MNVSNLFSVEEKQTIVDAIKKAELNTSAEIRVHIDRKCTGNVMDEATKVFDKLKMQTTKERNGVLLYIAIDSKKCAIIGDIGINRVVKEDFWNSCYDILKEFFRKEDYCNGIAKVIEMCSEIFSQNFKYQSDDKNELPDEISFGK